MEVDFVMGGGGVMNSMTSDLPSGVYYYFLSLTLVSFFMPILPGPVVKCNTEHSQHVHNWNALPLPLPLQNSIAYCVSEPTPFDLATIPLSSSQNQEAALFLPSDDATSLLPDIDYFALTEMGTTTAWDGLTTAELAALDTFEKNFGSYVYSQ